MTIFSRIEKCIVNQRKTTEQRKPSSWVNFKIFKKKRNPNIILSKRSETPKNAFNKIPFI